MELDNILSGICDSYMQLYQYKAAGNTGLPVIVSLPQEEIELFTTRQLPTHSTITLVLSHLSHSEEEYNETPLEKIPFCLIGLNPA